MHRLPSKKSIRIFRLAALLLWVRLLVPVVAVGVLLYGAILKHTEIVMLGMGIALLALILTLVQLLLAAKTRCPLCITPVLASKNCSKNRKSKTFLGSYRLRVANSILLRGHFRCPYCSEPTTLEVRSSRHPRH